MASTGPLPAWLMVVAALGGLPFTWGIAYSLYYSNKQQKKWLRVEVRIIRSGLTQTTRDAFTYHRPDVRYSYWVNGRRYESSRISETSSGYTVKSKAQREADKYPAGSARIALVNPDRPEEALLEWGYSWWAIALAFFIGLVWAGAWLAGWYSTYLEPYLRRHEWLR